MRFSSTRSTAFVDGPVSSTCAQVYHRAGNKDRCGGGFGNPVKRV